MNMPEELWQFLFNIIDDYIYDAKPNTVGHDKALRLKAEMRRAYEDR